MGPQQVISASSVSAASCASCTTASITEILDNNEKLPRGGSQPFDAPKIHNAFVDSVPTPAKDGSLLLQSFRDNDCTMLVSSAMVCCHNCTKLNERLRQKVHWKRDQETTPSGSVYTPNICGRI